MGSFNLNARQLSGNGRQIDALDGLRGLAVLIVFLSHTSNIGWHLIPGVDFSGTGKSGVYLFFLLSAFLLSRNIAQQGRGFWSVGPLLNYAVRRVLRIYPLYVLYILLGVVSFYGAQSLPNFEPHLNLGEALAHAGLQAGKSVAWSIPVEFKYYFVLPFASLLYICAHKLSALFGFAILGVSLVLSWFALPPSETIPNDIRTLAYLSIFLIGSYGGILSAQTSAWQPSTPARIIIGAAVCLAIAAFLYATPSVHARIYQSPLSPGLSHTWFIYFAVLWSAVLAGCLASLKPVSTLFESFPLRLLGRISFSFYLWHLTLIQLVGHTLPNAASPIKASMALVLSVLVSLVTYGLIERPASQWRIRSFDK